LCSRSTLRWWAQAPTARQVDEGFDRAWRRVGLALDRAGFTVEDRDRTQGIYFVRYINDATETKGFFSKLFSWGSSSEEEKKRSATVFRSKPAKAIPAWSRFRPMPVSRKLVRWARKSLPAARAVEVS
jgi:hypothetical protein